MLEIVNERNQLKSYHVISENHIISYHIISNRNFKYYLAQRSECL